MEISNNIQYRYNTNFNGLTRCLKKTVYNSDSMISAFAQAHPNSKGFAGNLPKEFILNIKKKNTVDVAKKIDMVKTAFSSLSVDLSKKLRVNEYDTKKYIFKEISFDDFLYAQAANDECGMMKALNKVKGVTCMLFDLMSDDELKKYNVKLATALKEANVLPASAKVKMTYLGSGSYGNAFKMSFLDRNNEKIFHDKVLKVYRTIDNLEYQNKYAFDTLKELINQSTEDEYINRINAITELDGNYRKISKKKLVKIYEFLKQAEIQDLPGCYTKYSLAQFHGVQSEANAALFIKKAIGKDISISNIVEPYCFDLENNYAIMEMSDKELKTLKKIKLYNLGIECYDQHDANFVNDKLIDYGGIKIIDKELLNNRKRWGNIKVKIDNK